MDKNSRIVIIGAGAGGLTTAWYLKQAGFKHVQVLEKSSRIGGKCRSRTVGGQSFDLGANYITSAYTRVRELAKRFDMQMYTEGPGHAFDLETKEISSLFKALTNNKSKLKLAKLVVKFMRLRLGLRKQLAPYAPGFSKASKNPELCKPFSQWLNENGLEDLREMFEIPISLMGYGKLSEVSTMYALTYMTPKTFVDLGLFALDPCFRCWPKRFTLGYERLFERVAAEVDVLRGVHISKIEREDKDRGITISYTMEEQELQAKSQNGHEASYDYLVLACPLTKPLLEKFLTLSDTEKDLFAQVQVDPFFVSTYHAPKTEAFSAVSYSLPAPEVGKPLCITRQFQDNDFISIYSRGKMDRSTSVKDVIDENRLFLEKIGVPKSAREPVSCDEWAYFPHVPPEQVKAGFYTKLENSQGQQRTFYTGGLLAFELVETIAEYSHSLVQQHFVKESK